MIILTERYYFFNSGVGDPRIYEASHFAEYFGSVLSTGLLHTDEIPGMVVSVQTGTLNTIVSAGKAIMKGRFYENTSPLTLTHAIPEVTLDRIDRIILRLNLSNAERNIKLMVLSGASSATPVAPALVRDNFIYDISLAQIRVRANTVQLLPGDLIDERLDENLAGLVYSLISIPTSQFQAEWDAFMAGIVDSGFATVASVDAVADDLATHQADYLKHTGYAVATGSANAYIATLNPALSAYAEGVSLRLKINIANTGASTVNVNGLGAKPILKSNGSAVASGNLKLGSVYTLAYDGTSFILQGEGGEYGTAVAGDVLTGKTIGTENGIVNGTLVAGKKWASGTVTVSVTTTTFVLGNGTNDTRNYAEVSGLTFNPSTVVLVGDNTSNARVTVLHAENIGASGNIALSRITATDPYNGTAASTFSTDYRLTGNAHNIAGFKLPVRGAGTYKWIAYE